MIKEFNTSVLLGLGFLFIFLPLAGAQWVGDSNISVQIGDDGGGGGGGGGGGTVGSSTGVVLAGRAYPLSRVTVLRDGTKAASTVAGPDAKFKVSLTDLSRGTYNFSVYGEDNLGLRSSLFNFTVYVEKGVTTEITGIFITPTIDVDKLEVAQGDNIAIFGRTIPNGAVTISVSSDVPIFKTTSADASGAYLYNLDTVLLAMGEHSTKSKSVYLNEVSNYGSLVSFRVGTQNIFKTSGGKFLGGDFNDDRRVNLVDFSIAAYWYKRPLSIAFKSVEAEKLNGDGVIDLADFSIIAYYWTG